MKLAGIRVIDLSVFLPGPYLTMAMADHGARVTKIEMPDGGDPGRAIGLADGPSTVFFRNLNRGKESVTLDLKTAAGRGTLLELCKSADVFVESFRPGVVQRLGLDYATLTVDNPGIVYCSLSAFGQDGPYRDRPAHDLAVEALCGVLSMTLGNDDQPTIPGVAIADVLAALNGLSGILMALLRREQTGLGDYVDISMQSSLLSATRNLLGPVFAEGRQPVAKHERSTGGSAFYRIYATADDRHLALGGQEPKFVRTLLGRLQREDLAGLCEQGPGPHQQPVMDFLAATFRTKTLAEWVDWFRPLDVCFAPVNTLPEAFDDDQIKARGLMMTDQRGRPHLGTPIRFLREPANVKLTEPALGADTARLANAPPRT